MRKILGALFIALSIVGSSLVVVQPAQAITCAQRDALMAAALSSGDIAAAASYRNMPCTSGSAPTITCAQKNINIANALSRGDLDAAAFWRGAACTGSSSGGSSGGSSVGSSGGGSVTAPPACTGAPSSPSVTSEYTTTGIRITVTPTPSSQTIFDLQYQYNTWDSVTRSWGTWIAWTSISGSSATTIELNPPSSTSTKIAFAAVARNTCAVSVVTRLDPDTKGVLFFNPPYDVVTQSVSASVVGRKVLVSEVFKSTSGTLASVNVLSPRICRITEGTLIGLVAGKCLLEVTTANSNQLVGRTMSFTVNMATPVKSITCLKNSNKKIKLTVSGTKPICPAGYKRA